MAENSAIEWTDHTFNPWEGCQKVGPGCDHCYAEARNARFGGGTAPNWGPGAPRRRTSAANWRQPLRWQTDAGAFHTEHGRRQRVFCASLADVFDNAVPDEWRSDLFALIRATPDLDWLLLTKRIGNVDAMTLMAGGLPENVWLGATIVDQAEADRDIPKLLAAPARIRFLSIEPLLGAVKLRLGGGYEDVAPDYWGAYHARLRGLVRPRGREAARGWRDAEMVIRHHPEFCQAGDGIRWVIVGGESGRGARPMHPDWVRDLRDQCFRAGVPFLFKQWGEHRFDYDRERDDPDWRRCDEVARRPGRWINLAGGTGFHGERVHYAERVGKSAAGRQLDGRQHDGFPA